jgi:hypothetical protein
MADEVYQTNIYRDDTEFCSFRKVRSPHDPLLWASTGLTLMCLDAL